MTIVTTIYAGYRIVTDHATLEVIGNMKLRGRYFYKVRNIANGRINTISRDDVLDAQRDGSAKVVH